MPDYRLQSTDYSLQTTDYRLQSTDYRLQSTDYRLPFIWIFLSCLIDRAEFYRNTFNPVLMRECNMFRHWMFFLFVIVISVVRTHKALHLAIYCEIRQAFVVYCASSKKYFRMFRYIYEESVLTFCQIFHIFQVLQKFPPMYYVRSTT
jgi:hypothetical protein